MTDSLRFFGLVAILLGGSGGWGWLMTWALERFGWHAARRVLDPSLQLVLGIALFICVGGVLVAAGIAGFAVLVTWQVAGVVILICRTAALGRRRALPTLGSGWSALALGFVGVFLAVLSLGIAIGVALTNENDDIPAYIYFAARLLRTGGLIDPFNFRRITSFGGSTVYDALFLRISGSSSLQGFEFTFSIVALLLVVVGSTRRRWLPAGVLVLGIALLVGHGVGPVVNLSPEYSVSALTLGAFVVLRRIAESPDARHPSVFLVLGLFVAAIVALRFYFVIPVALTILGGLWVIDGKAAWRPYLVTFGSTVVALGGWMVASWRSSATPFFALIPGDYNSSVPAGGDPHLRLSEYVSFVWSVFRFDGIGWVAVLAVTTGLALMAFQAQRFEKGALLAIAGLSCLVQIVVIAGLFTGSDFGDPARFVAPSTLACGLFMVHSLWPQGPRDVRTADSKRTARHRVSSRRRRLVTVLGTVGGCVVFGTVTFGGSVGAYAGSVREDVKLGVNVLRGAAGFRDVYSDAKAYGSINALIPKGAKVLAAVDEPALLDFSRFSFATVDIPGFASPPPHLPLEDGAMATVQYLRRLGYQYVVSESSSAQGLYLQQQWLNGLHFQGYFYRAYSPYMLRWEKVVAGMEYDSHLVVHRVGQLSLIKLA